MSGIRLFFGVPLAALITAGLFIIMNAMITSDVTLERERKIEKIVINAPEERLEGPDPVQPIVDPTLTKTPPAPELFPRNDGGPAPKPFRTGPVVGPVGKETTIEFPSILSPIVRIEPQYPDRCASRELEGSVLVEFDITAEGAVINPRILSSSSRCFNKSVLRAVTGWRYSPPGKLVRGQKTSLSFKLAN